MASPLRITALLAAAIATLVIAATSSGSPISAQTDPVVSVDTISDSSNTATTVGPTDPCLSTTSGASFDVDVVIQDVTDIAGFQANLLYDASVLNVTEVDYNFLLGTTGAAVLTLGDTVPDSDGDFQLAATMFSLFGITGASGDGVLARVTVQAVGPGTSQLGLTNVILADSAGNPIPPADASGVYQGPVNDGVVTVDSSCVLGDVDCDGAVSIGDALVITLFVLELLDPLPCAAVADVDGDGLITIGDALCIVLYVLELIPSLPCPAP